MNSEDKLQSVKWFTRTKKELKPRSKAKEADALTLAATEEELAATAATPLEGESTPVVVPALPPKTRGRRKREPQPLPFPTSTNKRHFNTLSPNLLQMQSELSSFGSAMQQVATDTSQLLQETKQLHRLYHNEFAGRLLSMQEELEGYRERAKGTLFHHILGEIAKLYSNNAALLPTVTDEKIAKQLDNMFLDLLQILESYDVRKQESAVGEVRNPRHCQVVGRHHTTDPSLHNTVARSISAGFYIENRNLVKELLEVYIYEAPPSNPDSEK
ncbi:MAG: nucleotide exchange factor GrpE [Symbiobacteriaceae bacterium]|nr:nucleotide exchange factor GrpE [Symbiobacteriaceae bacterium]